MNFFIGSREEKMRASWEAADMRISPFLSLAFSPSQPLISDTFFWLEPTVASSIVTASLFVNWKNVTKINRPIITNLNGFALWTRKPAKIAIDGISIIPYLALNHDSPDNP